MDRRIEKNVAGSITRYVYDGEDILLEYDGTNTFVARYSHGDQVDQPLVLQKAGQGFFYYHSNHQGSITHLTDSSGAIANSYIYDSYGRRLSVAESVVQPFSYTGREYDEESGLYFSRTRYFDANTGRFLSEDPIRFRGGDQNLYRYVLNNPVNFNDPSGLFFVALAPLAPIVLPGIEIAVSTQLAIASAAAIAAGSAIFTAVKNAFSDSGADVPSTFEARGKGEGRRTGDDFRGKSDQEVLDTLNDKTLPSELRQKAKREAKGRGLKPSRKTKEKKTPKKC